MALVPFTFEHVFYEDAALNDLLVGVELFIIGSDEEDHVELFVVGGVLVDEETIVRGEANEGASSTHK